MDGRAHYRRSIMAAKHATNHRITLTLVKPNISNGSYTLFSILAPAVLYDKNAKSDHPTTTTIVLHTTRVSVM